MKYSLVLVALLLISASVFAQAPLTVSRTIPPITQPNQEFTVHVQAQVSSGDPSGIIISETIPTGWSIVRADDACNINASKRLIKCLLYGENVERRLGYALKAPAAKPSRPDLINGKWETLSSSGTITGGVLDILPLTIAAAPATNQPGTTASNQNILLYAGLAVLVILIVGTAVWISNRKPQQNQKKA